MSTDVQSHSQWQDFLIGQGFFKEQHPLENGKVTLNIKQQAAYDNTQNNLFYLQSLNVIRICGTEATSFLQGQLSCDLKKINEEQSSIGTHNNIKGRMLSSFRIIKEKSEQEASYLLIIDNSIAETCIAQLKKYAVFSKVEITLEQELLVLGVESIEAINKLGLQTEELNINKVHHYENLPCLQVDLQAQRFMIICPIQSSINIWEALDKEFEPNNESLWQCADIIQGLAWVNSSTEDKFLAQTFNYHHLGGVSFNKGCYIGQEIIIRTEHRGNLKRGLFYLKLKSATHLNVGDELHSDRRSLGEIIASQPFSKTEQVVLAVLHRKFAQQLADNNIQLTDQNNDTLNVIDSLMLATFKDNDASKS